MQASNPQLAVNIDLHTDIIANITFALIQTLGTDIHDIKAHFLQPSTWISMPT